MILFLSTFFFVGSVFCMDIDSTALQYFTYNISQPMCKDIATDLVKLDSELSTFKVSLQLLKKNEDYIKKENILTRGIDIIQLAKTRLIHCAYHIEKFRKRA